MVDAVDPRLREVLQEVKDPEIPTVSILELGIVTRAQQKKGTVHVELTPTFVGCPALDMIRGGVEKRLGQLDGVERVVVDFVMDPPWTSDRITPEGRRKLEGFGIAPPKERVTGPFDIIPDCPYCGAGEGAIHNLFGPTACRSIFYCRQCNQPFEGMKPV
ncbi:1,2-phenylacetyl-CoA epoxidase subunit PaaD [Salinithrix halophila]|uniref:1,2-phenylacetyl-CoA epoxidase subunit PaaD n=1 Tax=Salinithrix halophila TaxID=1485204 RepID=A0ABV8JAU7_9BACL